MQHIINQVHNLLIKKEKTVAVAESCTGGLLSKFLTDISGSSKHFILGIVAYSNKAKESVLKIPSNLINKKGAVSSDVAKMLAVSVRKLAGADFGIGLTGVAGPTGARPNKPLGTVFVAIDSQNKKLCKKFNFRGNRLTIRKMAALKSLELLKNIL